MPWSGAGTYSLPGAYTPEVNGTTIDAARYNGATSDIAAGVSACLAKNGENVPTANLPMGGYKHTGAADASAAGQYLVYGQASASLTSITLSGTLTANGAVVLGDASGDTLTIAGNAVTWSNNPTHSGNHTYSGNLTVQGNTILGNAGTDTVTVTGNVTLNAPSSGDAVTVTGVSGGLAGRFNMPANGDIVAFIRSGGSNQPQARFTANETTNATKLNFTANAGSPSGALQIAGSDVVVLGANREVTIAQPVSGNTLALANSASLGISAVQLFLSDPGANSTRFAIAATNTHVYFVSGGSSADPDYVWTTNDGTEEYLRLTNDGRLFGKALHNNAGSVTGTTNQYIASGTYTPTLTNVTNVSASTARQCQWVRVGNVVTVSGQLDVTCTAGTTTPSELGISLPIASNFTTAYQCGGVGRNYEASVELYLIASIDADSTNDRARFRWNSQRTVSLTPTFMFTYEIV